MGRRGSGVDIRLIALPHLGGRELADSISCALSGLRMLAQLRPFATKPSGAPGGRHARCVTDGTPTGESELDDRSHSRIGRCAGSSHRRTSDLKARLRPWRRVRACSIPLQWSGTTKWSCPLRRQVTRALAMTAEGTQ